MCHCTEIPYVSYAERQVLFSYICSGKNNQLNIHKTKCLNNFNDIHSTVQILVNLLLNKFQKL
jgi:hypothetical protein